MIQLPIHELFHKIQLNRLLIALVDHPHLGQWLRFKGGTCAAMLGLLDRFSVDLDFDVKPGGDETVLRGWFDEVFKAQGLTVADESKHALEFFVKYQAPKDQRNTIQVDALSTQFQHNVYEPKNISEIHRVVWCQSEETMVSHKLVAPLDRYAKHKSIAGRDIYDIHYFLSHGMKYNSALIEERTGKGIQLFFRELREFVETHVSQTVIDQDLNMLLSREDFSKIRLKLKDEVLLLLGAARNRELV